MSAHLSLAIDDAVRVEISEAVRRLVSAIPTP